ncbi:MAG TPA: class II aldolase/adducin family protein [Thermomicrobiales bacterium]|jgi:L-fuculose-phosphate aldolase|nr:class II aldolase family protein [Chloroflexota bacterium]HQX63192.1 class II aldolase/adducin family protein [Thermomicrobiales bacterium]HQZ89008.1 class II aldolase/adducin family protein [Thermomicrobiales bacterium]HRA31920.1 class II aldolase/adducin family protein [Thermomicrobiales bacterium]
MSWSPEVQPFADRVCDSAHKLAAGHAVLSHSLHGNISIRLPEGDRFLLTGGGTLEELKPSDLALLTLDGELLGGHIEPASNEIIQMHAAVYRRRPDVNGVVHTHSPYVTAYAIAHKPIEPTYEAMVRFDINEAVPVAAYGPRGSESSVTNIVDVVNDSNKAVLLANHGLLAFDTTLEKATHLVFVLEEAAQFSLMANVIGGPQPLPMEAIRAAQQRRDEFERAGSLSAAPDDK